MKRAWVWRLRTHLFALLLATMLLTFTVVSVSIMVGRAPEIERRSQVELQAKIVDTTAMLEMLLGTRLARIEVLAGLVHDLPPSRYEAVLDGGLDYGSVFRAMYLLSPEGVVEAVVAPHALRARGSDLVGSDLSGNAQYQAVQSDRTSAWSGKYMSILSGEVSVGLAFRAKDGRVLIGELPLKMLLPALGVARGKDASSIWIVDRSGEVLADTEEGRLVGKINILNWPLMQALLHHRPVPAQFRFERHNFKTAALQAQGLDWFVVGRVPMGLDHPGTRRLIWDIMGLLAGCLTVGLMIAPWWAQRMARPLQQIVARAAQTTAGQSDGCAWPRGSVAEFNRLAGDLEAMAASLQDRELQFLAVFNAAPVPMGLVNPRSGQLLDVNEVWCLQLARCREDVIGRTTVEIGMWTAAQRTAMVARMQDGQLGGESLLWRGDGQPFQAQVFGRHVTLPTQELMIWAVVDTSPIRRFERELRELNQELESRVALRTQDLASSNDALSESVKQLRDAQDELVRAEKMAALGSLVAGVAHELNTPLGNGVMAISAMADATRSFAVAMQGGLKRADLQRFVASVEQGVDIAERNLRRAADLVHSFKQVAVDQTSAKRRIFELSEVVHEMVTSLRPSFSRTPYRIEVHVPMTGLRLDSYPGALGQAIGAMVQNSMLHGFEGKDHGTVCIEAALDSDDRIVLRVTDDGHGIAAEHLGRVFAPFMTTKMGQGGSGLGLPISYNAVVNLLGGTLTVHSVEGQGARFEMRIPAQAPQTSSAQAAHGDGTRYGEVWQ